MQEIKSIPISERTSQALAATIVVFRTLGFCKQESIEAMQELHIRKLAGDTFDYNSYIDEKIKAMPDISVGEKQMEAFKSVIKNVKTGII